MLGSRVKHNNTNGKDLVAQKMSMTQQHDAEAKKKANTKMCFLVN